MISLLDQWTAESADHRRLLASEQLDSTDAPYDFPDIDAEHRRKWAGSIPVIAALCGVKLSAAAVLWKREAVDADRNRYAKIRAKAIEKGSGVGA